MLLKRGPHRLEMTEIGQALFQSLRAHRRRSRGREHDRLGNAVPAARHHAHLHSVRACEHLDQPGAGAIRARVSGREAHHPRHQSWVDVSEEPYDVAIYIGRVRNEHLPVRRLAELPRGVYGSPAYLRTQGRAAEARGSAASRLHRARNQLAIGLWTFESPGRSGRPWYPRMTVSDIVAAREMVDRRARLRHPDARDVARPTCKETARARAAGLAVPPVDLSATFLERRHMPLRIRAFIDMLAHAIKRAAHGSERSTLSTRPVPLPAAPWRASAATG